MNYSDRNNGALPISEVYSLDWEESIGSRLFPRGNASNYRGCLMAVECTINVGFHSNLGRFRQSGHSKTPLRLVIINGLRSTQPTTYVAPLGRESEFPRTRVATWRSRDLYRISIAFAIHSLDHSLSARLILQKTQFLTVRSINPANYSESGSRHCSSTK